MPLYTRRNNELVQMLDGDFQRRYDAALHWANACSCVQALPGLRGLWPFGAMDNVGPGNAIDQSGHGHTLAINGNPLFNYSILRPYCQLDGTGDYFSTVDAADFDILGTEAYVTVSRRGIAMGGWFYCTALPDGVIVPWSGLITKWNVGVSQSYMLYLLPTGAVRGIIEDGAGNQDSVTSTNTIGVDEWFFAGFTWTGTTGTYTTMSAWLSDLDEPDGLVRTDGVPVRAAIRNSTADFCIGGTHGGARLLTGYVSMCWLSAMCLNEWDAVNAAPVDAIVWSVFQQTRALYGI